MKARGRVVPRSRRPVARLQILARTSQVLARLPLLRTAARQTPIDALRRIWPALWLGCVTTVLGLVGLAWTSFPGIREIAFWNDDDGIDVAFPEIENLANECRFSNCSHMHEPGCRVLQAVTEGEIMQDRLESYQKMKRELTYLSRRQHKSADRVEKEQWKEVALKIKAIKKRRRNG